MCAQLASVKLLVDLCALTSALTALNDAQLPTAQFFMLTHAHARWRRAWRNWLILCAFLRHQFDLYPRRRRRRTSVEQNVTDWQRRR